MSAAGLPRAVSRTWVVRKPPTCSAPPLHPALYLTVRVLARVENLVVVLYPEPLEIVEDMVHVGERVPDLLYLREPLEHRLTRTVQGVLGRGAVVVGKGLQGLIQHPVPQL